MQHTPTSTADGSSTLLLTQFGETYHSRNGAYTEAMHIYIKNGLEHLFESVAHRSHTAPAETPAVGDTSGPDGSPVHLNIFDVGLGTGLNCILTWVWQQQLRQAGLPYPRITYCGIEKYPVHTSEIEQFNYPTIIAQHTDFPPDKLSGRPFPFPARTGMTRNRNNMAAANFFITVCKNKKKGAKKEGKKKTNYVQRGCCNI